MSVTVTKQNVDDRLASMRIRIADVSPGTYATGGVALAASDFSLSDNAVYTVIPIGSGGYVPVYDDTNKKLLVYQTASASPSFTVKTGTIVAGGGVGLTADATTAGYVGGTAITTDRTLTTQSPVGSISAGVLTEVGTGTSLASTSFRCICIMAK